MGNSSGSSLHGNHQPKWSESLWKDITDSYPTPFPSTFGGLAGKYPGVVDDDDAVGDDDDDVVGDDDDDNDDDDGSTVDR